MGDTIRRITFFLVCVPVRIFISVGVSLLDRTHQVVRYVLASLFLLISIGFCYTYRRNKKKGAFGGEVWWHANRPFHAAIYATSAGLLFASELHIAATLLACDVALGVGSAITQYKQCKNKKKDTEITSTNKPPIQPQSQTKRQHAPDAPAPAKANPHRPSWPPEQVPQSSFAYASE